ncbi:glycosyltransferase family 4 protein [Planctomyces sp. SH-PL14]|uniref:glycosyltransferase family 4 protein n=1 Tax=Planctomyces sp. SH-PL14 TaxID=1632864 RepID=UPI00078D66CA|nr:glycosyltransferase family 4 protein [Planctomyces sp. SH-PL14]AMV20826.1 D-inositol 3-phosphate glycosyltransferase [Planctomyces sp. SH-PL14]
MSLEYPYEAARRPIRSIIDTGLAEGGDPYRAAAEQAGGTSPLSATSRSLHDAAQEPYCGPDARSFSAEPYAGSDARSFAAEPYAGLNVRSFAAEPYAGLGTARGAASAARDSAEPTPGQGTRGGRPIRVAFVCSFLYGAGIENWMVGLRQYSDPAAVQFVRCVVTTSLVDERIVRRLGIPVTVGQAEAVRAAAVDADVLIVSGPAQVGDWLADRPRCRVVFVAHGDGHWTRDILNCCRGVVDEVVAVSRRVQEAVGSGFRTTVIHNGIDPAHLVVTEDPALVRRRLGFGPDDFVLGYVGRFSPEKNVGALVDAVERLPEGFKLLLVGFGPERAELMDRANRRIPGRYTFTEAHQDLGALYHAMDAFGLPSLSEGYGLVLMEAMFCGRPVISGPVGFAPEALQDRVNGMVVDGTPEGFAGAARLLRDHPEWRKGVGQEARAFALRYGLAARMAEKYRRFLSTVVR